MKRILLVLLAINTPLVAYVVDAADVGWGIWEDNTREITYAFLKNNELKIWGKSAKYTSNLEPIYSPAKTEGVWESGAAICSLKQQDGNLMIHADSLQCCMLSKYLGSRLVLSAVWKKGDGPLGACDSRVLNRVNETPDQRSERENAAYKKHVESLKDEARKREKAELTPGSRRHVPGNPTLGADWHTGVDMTPNGAMPVAETTNATGHRLIIWRNASKAVWMRLSVPLSEGPLAAVPPVLQVDKYKSVNIGDQVKAASLLDLKGIIWRVDGMSTDFQLAFAANKYDTGTLRQVMDGGVIDFAYRTADGTDRQTRFSLRRAKVTIAETLDIPLEADPIAAERELQQMRELERCLLHKNEQSAQDCMAQLSV